MRQLTVVHGWQSGIRRSGAAFLMLVFLLGLPVPHAGASELGEFNSAFAEAWDHYRQASFYGRTNNAAIAGLELDAFIARWSELMARFGDDPPDAFAADEGWKQTLNSIAVSASRALEHFDAGDGETAMRTLVPLRKIAHELRRRNGVTVYSDDVDELSAAMDILARYRREIGDLGDRDARDRVTRQAAVVAYLFRKCDERAPGSVRDDPEFRRLIDGARESMGKLWGSLRSGNMRLYRIGIGELRSYERILFLRFG